MPEGLTAVAGEIIEMNRHSVMSGDAVRAVLFGAVLAAAFTGALVAWFQNKNKDKSKVYPVIFAVLILAGAVLFTAGVKAPKKKRIMACVTGPVSLQHIAEQYDIVDIDGKMLTLMER